MAADDTQNPNPAAEAAKGAPKAAAKKAVKPPPLKVRARERGYYNGLLVEEGEVFSNTLGLKAFGPVDDKLPEEEREFDKHAWFEAVTAKKVDPDEA